MMSIEDDFSITGRGTVATGRIERGVVKVGDEVEIVGMGETRKTTSRALKCSASSSTRARRATMSACSCAALKRTRSSAVRFSRNPEQSLPTRRPRPKFTSSPRTKVAVTLLLHELSSPVLLRHCRRHRRLQTSRRRRNGYAGRQPLIEIELQKPIAMEKGQRFAIREGGRTIGAGRISEIIA